MSNSSMRAKKLIQVASCAAVLAACAAWASAGPPNYMIIHGPAFTGSSGLSSLITAKQAQGFNVRTKAFSGATTETIKAYIQSFWNTPDAPDYILLIGDSDSLPWFTGAASKHAVSDLYYGCMDGPDDWYPDIPVGRFALRTTAQLTAAVAKTLYVEAGTYADPTYVTRAAFLASDDPEAQSAETHDWVIANYTTQAGITPTRVYYPYPSGAGTTEISAAVNAGALFVTYMGHSGQTTWFAPAFNQTNINNLTNANKYGLVLSMSCDTANFTAGDACFGETWLRVANKGAAAYISATNRIFYDTPEEWEAVRRLEKYFFKAVFEDGEYRVGPAWHGALYYFLADPDYGPTHEYTRNYFEEFEILGDPALMLPVLGFQLGITPPLQKVCSTPASVQYTIQVDPHAGFNQVVTLAASGYPAGWNVTFSQNSLPPPFTSVMTVSNITSAPGTYDFTVTGTSAAGMHRYATATVHRASGVPGAVVLSTPASGASAIPLSPVLTWQAATQAAEYELQIGTTSSFSTIVYSATTRLTTHNVDDYLDPLTTYHWRVRGVNGCGAGAYSMERSFQTVEPPNYLTEQFSGVPIDFENYTYKFVPNGSPDFYDVCGEPATALPTNPSGGYAISLMEDGSELMLPNNDVWLYGTSYMLFYVNANGNFTFNDYDSTAAESLSVHFNQPRISTLFTDLSPQLGSVSYKDLADRFVVTFQNVPEKSTTNMNTFQVELFYTSHEIHITWLNSDAVGAVVGLSRGLGVPDDFFPTDFSDYPCIVRGDMNCDGAVNAFDIDPFVVALTDPVLYESTYECELLNGDTNCDGSVNTFDIDPFVLCLTGGCPDCP
jgi:hypothetical protein